MPTFGWQILYQSILLPLTLSFYPQTPLSVPIPLSEFSPLGHLVTPLLGEVARDRDKHNVQLAGTCEVKVLDSHLRGSPEIRIQGTDHDGKRWRGLHLAELGVDLAAGGACRAKEAKLPNLEACAQQQRQRIRRQMAGMHPGAWAKFACVCQLLKWIRGNDMGRKGDVGLVAHPLSQGRR